ncbi:hypothetical protein ACSBQT_15630 [Brevibacterium sp. H602]
MTTTDLDTSITVAADGVVSALLRSTSRQWAEAVDLERAFFDTAYGS